jgi:hypothetical protein
VNCLTADPAMQTRFAARNRIFIFSKQSPSMKLSWKDLFDGFIDRIRHSTWIGSTHEMAALGQARPFSISERG